jgi:hypothetical protein
MAEGTKAGLPYPEGDPGALARVSSRLGTYATAVAAEAADVGRAARPTRWTGGAAIAFAALVGALGASLRDSAAALLAAARPVAQLAATLDDAQRQIERWSGEIEDAERGVDAARAELDAARRRVAARSALPGTSLGGSPLAASPLDPEVVAAQSALTRAVGRADELRRRCRAKARLRCDEVDAADRAAGAALEAAAKAAPSGGSAAPGARDVPTPVRTFAPVWLFHPDERYLPASAEPDLRFAGPVTDYVRDPLIGLPLVAKPFVSVDGLRYPTDPRYLRGQGAGAPIYYRDRKQSGGRVIEYWVYRRHNDFRGLGAAGGAHPGDWEAVAVRLDARDRPISVAYSQHSGACSLPWDSAPKRGGHPLSHAALGSGANYPWPGSYDDVPSPFDDLASGQGRGERVVYGQDNPRDYDKTPLRNYDWRWGEDNSPQGPHKQSGKFALGSDTWQRECESPEKRGG